MCRCSAGLYFVYCFYFIFKTWRRFSIIFYLPLVEKIFSARNSILRCKMMIDLKCSGCGNFNMNLIACRNDSNLIAFQASHKVLKTAEHCKRSREVELSRTNEIYLALELLHRQQKWECQRNHSSYYVAMVIESYS